MFRIRSPIDHFPMDGIRNSRIHYAGQRSPMFRLRWTDLFFIECYLNNNESFDPTRLADSLAKAFIQALTPYVDMLVEAKFRKLGLRVTIDRENVSRIISFLIISRFSFTLGIVYRRFKW